MVRQKQPVSSSSSSSISGGLKLSAPNSGGFPLLPSVPASPALVSPCTSTQAAPTRSPRTLAKLLIPPSSVPSSSKADRPSTKHRASFQFSSSPVHQLRPADCPAVQLRAVSAERSSHHLPAGLRTRSATVSSPAQTSAPPSARPRVLSISTSHNLNPHPHPPPVVPIIKLNSRRFRSKTITAEEGVEYTSASLYSACRDVLPSLLLLTAVFALSSFAAWRALTSLPELRFPTTLSGIQDVAMQLRMGYMGRGWAECFHVVGIVSALFLWKQAWSIPGSAVVNIIFGSLLPTVPATLLSCFLTALGGTLCYLLSMPFGPFITRLWPSALVSARKLVQPSSNAGKSSSWKLFERLLLARLAPVIPYSVLNIASGVLRVPFLPFFATLFLGSLPLNGLFCSLGGVMTALSSTSGDLSSTESLTDRLLSPMMVFKFVCLTLLGLVPILIKPFISKQHPEVTNESEEFMEEANPLLKQWPQKTAMSAFRFRMVSASICELPKITVRGIKSISRWTQFLYLQLYRCIHSSPGSSSSNNIMTQHSLSYVRQNINLDESDISSMTEEIPSEPPSPIDQDHAIPAIYSSKYSPTLT